MIDTGYWSLQDDVPNLALGYTRNGARPGEPRKVTTTLGRGAGPAGGTGPYSTAEDMLRFSEALRNHKLLNKESTDLYPGRGGYGMLAGSTNGVRFAGHGGGTAGVNTYFEMYPDLGYTFVALSNYDNGANLVYERVREEITGEELPRAISLSADVLKQFEGRYAPAPGRRAGEGDGE